MPQDTLRQGALAPSPQPHRPREERGGDTALSELVSFTGYMEEYVEHRRHTLG